LIEIIYNTSNLEGTCYIEILPDKYSGVCWNTSSIFFSEDNFGYIMPVFEKCHKKFDYYAFNEIEIDTWKLILKELEAVKQYLSNNPDPRTLKEVLGFPFVYSEREFNEDYESNLLQLISMITEFQVWISEKSLTTKYISVLGI
jgi:hypothetical protein